MIPGGALDVSISGFARFLVAYGDIDKKPNLAQSNTFRDFSTFDFLNDTELHVIVRGRHDATGIEYGGTIEFEADTNQLKNTDESWIFARGGFGEFRLGDTGSAANNMKIGGYTVAVGTGGIDGKVVEIDPPILVDFSNRSADPFRDTLNATKLIYYSPVFSGLQLGISYAPNIGQANSLGDSLAVRGRRGANTPPFPGRPNGIGTDNTISDEVTFGVAYSGAVGPVGLRGSVVGAVAAGDVDDTRAIFVGAAAQIGDFSVAGGVGHSRRGNRYILERSTLERVLWSAGVAYDLDPFSFSITYAWADGRGDRSGVLLDEDGVVVDSDALNNPRHSDLVFGIEVGLLPGLALSTELARFSIKRGPPGQASEDVRADNDGWVGVTRLALTF